MMSNKMLEDQEPSNPFDKLSDDPILHILSFLPGKDLLHLSTVDKNFKRIVTESHETMRKICLVLDFESEEAIDDGHLDVNLAIKLAQTRRFSALKLNPIYLADIHSFFNVEVVSLLKTLSKSVDDLTVLKSDLTSQKLLSSAITILLPNLKKCKLTNVSFDDEASTLSVAGIDLQSSVNHPLESLELINTHACSVLQLFNCCKQLKSFINADTYGVTDTAEDTALVNNFLATQYRLEKLNYRIGGLEWNRLTCFQLTELKIASLTNTNEQLAAAEFLQKLPNLVKLHLDVNNHPSCQLMGVICDLPKLKKFEIRTWKDDDAADDGDSLEKLVNTTVKELRVEDITDITPKLLKIFLGVDSIFLDVRTDVLDLSDVPSETIMKIKVHQRYCDNFFVKFSPSELPTNVEAFQSAVMTFAEEFHEYIEGIEIGHENWRNREAFALSNNFCEGLVNLLPNLIMIRVFNIADSGKFILYLRENQQRLNLRNIKLHEPFGVDEPKPKKMKFHVE